MKRLGYYFDKFLFACQPTVHQFIVLALIMFMIVCLLLSFQVLLLLLSFLS